jgi:hypothetical protein
MFNVHKSYLNIYKENWTRLTLFFKYKYNLLNYK